MSNIGDIPYNSKIAKMDQLQPKTHKIQKKYKSDETKKQNSKSNQQSQEESLAIKGFNAIHNQKQLPHRNVLSPDESICNSTSNIEMDKKTQHSDSFDYLSQSGIKSAQSDDFNNQDQGIICRNSSSQLMNQNYYKYNVTPRILLEPSESKCFCLYNEVVLDFDLVDENQCIYQKSLTQALTNFKKVNQIQKLNNGDLIEVQQESFSNPIIEYTFLINQLRSLNNSEAYKWSQALQIFQQKTKPQISHMINLKQSQEGQTAKLKNIFQQRKQFAMQMAQKISKQIPRNSYCTYVVFNYDYEGLTVRQSCTGYSRKLLDIMGISINDAPTVFLRKGPLDLINKKTHTWNMLLAAIQLTGHPKQEVIDVAEGETFIQTLDNIQLHAKISIKTSNLTYQFDRHQNIDLPIQDDIMVEIYYDIDQEDLIKFHQKRQEKKIFDQFSVYDIIDGEFEYLMEVENFLQKYYEANISSMSSKKKAEFEQKKNQSDKMQSASTSKNYNKYSQFDSSIISKHYGDENSSLEKNIVITKGKLIVLLDDQDPTSLI